MKFPLPRVLHVVDGAILVEYGDAAEADANAAAVVLAGALRESGLEGFHDAIPGARTLFCEFDPALLSHEALARRIVELPLEDSGSAPAREHRVAVRYGGPAALDLPEVARLCGLPPEEIAGRHAAASYRVAFLGFAPGFAYMTGLPPELRVPRRPSPRTRVPAGALAIAGPYTGIYPAAGPGGWNLIGSAAVRLFDPADTAAGLQPGDRVVFERRSDEEFDRELAAAVSGRRLPGSSSDEVFRVETPGLWSSVCGGPRHGSGRFGLPPGGAMDVGALHAGNALAGNAKAAGGLEIAFSGPTLESLEDFEAVLSGAPCEASIGGRPVRRGEPFQGSRGERLSIGAVRPGARSYLCVRGGLLEEEIRGPIRPLAAGERIRRGSRAGSAVPHSSIAFLSDWGAPPPRPVVRIVLGPQDEQFAPQGVTTFLESEYRVSSASDRRGIRLEGPSIAFAGSGPDVPPEGTALGAIQVPGDGQPIVLGPDRPVTGGYAKIGAVIAADLGLLAQARPGAAVRFQAVTLDQALRARDRMARP